MSGSGGRRKTDGLSEAVEPEAISSSFFSRVSFFTAASRLAALLLSGRYSRYTGVSGPLPFVYLGASAAAVRSEAFLEIVGPARVEGAVTALQDVYAGPA